MGGSGMGRGKRNRLIGLVCVGLILAACQASGLGNSADSVRKDPYSNIRVQYPIDANCPTVESWFGDTKNIQGGERRPGVIHNALDIPAPQGTPVVAAASGTVIHWEPNSTIGQNLHIISTAKQNGVSYLRFIYAHINVADPIRRGEHVEKGDVLGYVSSHYIGDHLHYNIRRTRYNSSSVNPLEIYPSKANQSGQRIISIPYMDQHGNIPSNKIMWPFVCERTQYPT